MMKFEYMVFDDFQNQKNIIGVAIYIGENKLMPIFKIIYEKQDYIKLQSMNIVKQMIKIFDDSVYIDNQQIIKPKMLIWNFTDDILQRYKEYVK